MRPRSALIIAIIVVAGLLVALAIGRRSAGVTEVDLESIVRVGTLQSFVTASGEITAMRSANIVWDEKTISEYIVDPKKFIPGNKMTLAPIKDKDQRDDLIAYLKEQQKK